MATFTAPGGASLYYEDTGEGPAVLALAGLSRSCRDFDDAAPYLGGVRLIRMDYRGRGRSDWTGPDTYSIPQEAQDALALLDHLGLSRAAVLGTSRGGLIAMTLAATARERLSGVVLNDVGPVLEAGGLAYIRDYIGRNPPQRTHIEVARARARDLPGFAGVSEAQWLAEARRLFDETPEGLVIRYDPELRTAVLASAEALAKGPPPDLWPLYDALAGLPLCLIRGANSSLLSAATFDEMCRRRPDAVAAVVPDRGHVPFLDEPAAVAALTEWKGQLA